MSPAEDTPHTTGSGVQLHPTALPSEPIWLLSSNPQPLADSGQAEDAAATGGGGNSDFPAAFGGVGATGEREGRFLFGGESTLG
jgi:hypothetical protein